MEYLRAQLLWALILAALKDFPSSMIQIIQKIN
jgi:hypothetical protein